MESVDSPAFWGYMRGLMTKIMRAFLAPIIFLCFTCAAPAVAAQPQFPAHVIAVADGDTITVLTKDKRQVRIRLYGIDCPEKVQAFGNRATQATSDAVYGKDVLVRPMDTDHYGNLVAIVLMPNGASLNERLVRDGLAWVYTRYCKDEDICAPLRKLEASVRATRRGLWVDKKPVPPWEWRR